MSKYDNIETAADLIAEVSVHGLSTNQDDLNRAADIFGNTSVCELARLANDIGRNNERGEPDPNGSWSSNRKPTQGTFYFIAFNIWHWEQASAFFNEHTNPVTKNQRVRRLENSLKNVENERDKYKIQLAAIADCARGCTLRVDELTVENQKKDAEILTLKAKLYDMIEGD